ncbi:DUF4157 domain-containing protein [Draconibacterium sp.]|nr:DUF4157 domain-containing protein [Draconibacterium sp.]
MEKTAVNSNERSVTTKAAANRDTTVKNETGSLEEIPQIQFKFNEGRTFSSPYLQPKLSIGQPNDRYEQEADRVADRIVQMPEPASIKRTCAGCPEEELQTKPAFPYITPLIQRQVDEEEEELVQTKLLIQGQQEEEEEPLQAKTYAGDLQASTNLESQLNATKGVGTPLPENTNRFMSQAFGTDFSRVRVHSGSTAVQMNQGVNSKAFTQGSDIYFNSGQYNPDSLEGKRLLGHELTHVVQQGGQRRFVQHTFSDKHRITLSTQCALAGIQAKQKSAQPEDICKNIVNSRISKIPRTSSAITQVLQRNYEGRYVRYVIEPRELPSQAGRRLQIALLRGIPPDRRHDEGLVLLTLLPGLANILDPLVTAASNSALIINRAMPWHPASYGDFNIPTPYVYALWDYYKARWESEDLRMRRRHISVGLSHWHRLILPRIFNNFVVRERRREIRDLVRRLIETPGRRLRSNTTFDVLSHGGVPLTAEERTARERRRAEERERRRSLRRGISRSETMDIAPGDISVTSGEARTVRFINPEALRFVPHRAGVSPRRRVFNPLAAVLNELRTARENGNVDTIVAVKARLATEEETTRERMRDYVRPRRSPGPNREDALATINTLDLTVDVEVRSRDVDIGSFRVHLEPVAPGALIERPGGFTASVREIASGRSVRGRASEEVMNTAVSGFNGDEQIIALQFLEVIRRGEGSLTSLNTWDRLRITLGSGIGAAGVLQDMYAMFARDDPAAYERIFGRHGIGIVARGQLGRSGRSQFRTTGEEGEQLVGHEAREQLANDPHALAVMVTAGFDPAWQGFLLRGGVTSIRRGLSVTFQPMPDGTVILAEEGEGIRVYDWLHSHVSANMLSVAIFSFALDFHAANLRSETVSGFGTQYNAAAEDTNFAPANPDSAPDEARRIIASWLVNERRHQNRVRHINDVLGVESYDAITSM